eukprot:TRINITY_DN40833_c0_g1_i1.p1 TRINITY_DN40833_c0_g1~~TRINITY_DN40833_c0_g1_i1.p1  ORF type:complete len:478 (-),score=28.67 TRINITY_DN40833_c0_g1_i1:26-1459(-)
MGAIFERIAFNKQARALALHQERLHEWSGISKKLMLKTGKSYKNLVGLRTEQFRIDQERKTLMERALPLYENPESASFWRQASIIGNPLSGLSVQSKLFFEEPILQIGKPGSPVNTVSQRTTWRNSSYMQLRSHQLSNIFKKLNPFQPDFEHLIVVGTRVLFPNSVEDPIAIDDGISETMPIQSCIPNAYTDNQKCTVRLSEYSILLTVYIAAGQSKIISSSTQCAYSGSVRASFRWSLCDLAGEGQANHNYFCITNSQGTFLPNEFRQFDVLFKAKHAGVFHVQYLLTTLPNTGVTYLNLKGIVLNQEELITDKFLTIVDLNQISLQSRPLYKFCTTLVRNIINQAIKEVKEQNQALCISNFSIGGTECWAWKQLLVDCILDLPRLHSQSLRRLKPFHTNDDRQSLYSDDMGKSRLKNRKVKEKASKSKFKPKGKFTIPSQFEQVKVPKASDQGRQLFEIEVRKLLLSKFSSFLCV